MDYFAFSWSLRLNFVSVVFWFFKLSCDFVGVYHCLFGFYFFLWFLSFDFLSIIWSHVCQLNLGQLSIYYGDYRELRIIVTKTRRNFKSNSLPILHFNQFLYFTIYYLTPTYLYNKQSVKILNTKETIHLIWIKI